MKANTANSTFSNDEFDELMKDTANSFCFDCGKTPASWASVNNGIYLCLNCAGNHRSYGVNISYIRSITIDTWNETQLSFMKLAGNKRLEELMAIFEVPRNTPSQVLFSSKLLEYYRNQLKNDVNKGKQLIPPRMDEALQPMESILNRNEYHSNPTPNMNFYSVGSDFDQNNNKSESSSYGYLSSVGSLFGKVVEKSKSVASNVKDKVVELDLKNKVISTGSMAVEKLKETGSVVKEKTIHGVEVLKDTSGKVLVKGKEYGVSFKK
jgi:ADP-ribosylation factor GTPase-activating protein 1